MEKFVLIFNSDIHVGASLLLSKMLLCHSATLKTVDLQDSFENLSIVGWQALFQLLQDHWRS